MLSSEMGPTPQGFELVPYAEDHARFVFGTFVATLLSHPNLWRGSAVRSHRQTLGRVLRDPRTNAVVATPRGHGNDFIGWGAAINGVLVFAYVRDALRGMGFCRAMLKHLSVEAPTPVAYWTRDCSLLASAGKPLYFDVMALDGLARLVH